MKEFLVDVREVVVRTYRIEAKNGKKAVKKMKAGEHGDLEEETIEESVIGDVREA